MNWARRGAKSAESNSSLKHITGAVVDSALHLHKALGPGLLESVFEAILARVSRAKESTSRDSVLYRSNIKVSASTMPFASTCLFRIR